jgi:hypothetical protein
MIAHSLWFDRDLELTNNYVDQNNIVYAGNLKPEAHLVKGKNGYYSVHSFGLPLIFLPIFGFAYHVSSSFSQPTLAELHLTQWTLLRLVLALAMIFLSATLAIQLYDFIAQKIDLRISLLIVLVCFLSIPLLPMSFLFFTEMPAAFLAFVSFKFINYEDNSWAPPILSAASLAYLPFLHVKYYLLAIVLLIFLLFRFRSSPFKLQYALVILAIFCSAQGILAVVNRTTLGTVLPFAAYGNIPLDVSNVWKGLLGLFLDQEFGLLWFSPIYVLAPAGLLLLYRSQRGLAIQYSLLALSVIMVCAAYPMWWGGWSPAARFLTPAIVFLIHPLATAFNKMFKAGKVPKILCLALIVLQLGFAIIFWVNPKLMWNHAWGQSYFHSKVLPGYTHNLPSLIQSSKWDVELGCIYAFTLGVLTYVIFRKSEDRNVLKQFRETQSHDD